MNYAYQKILQKLPKEQQNPEILNLFHHQLTPIVSGILNENIQSNVEKIKNSFNTTVNKLAGIDPVLAYKLSGQENVFQIPNILNNFVSQFSQGETSQATSTTAIEPSMMASLHTFFSSDGDNGIDMLIESISRKLSMRHRKSVRVQMNLIASQFGSAGNEELEKLIDKLTTSMGLYGIGIVKYYLLLGLTESNLSFIA